MRKEIMKFRSWDSFNQKMSFFSMNDLCNWQDDNPEKPSALSEWMQYTGLHDKNGKEIYEGDVVRGNPIGSTGIITGSIVWMNDGWYVSDETERDLEKRLHEDFFSKVEIIGNIYENPELLTK